MISPSRILENLIRFDTSNPPGHEKDCVLWIRDLLAGHGFQTEVFAKDPERPNLVARMKGQGNVRPLLLYGHADVVPAHEPDWTCPPFSGKTVDGCVWGRGALDMKGGLAIMMSALLSLASQNHVPQGDVIFTVLCDEETGGDLGGGFMVSQHPGQFEGVRYAIGEFGGFPFYVGKTCFYPIQIGEKQVCWMKGRLKGKGGHGSQVFRGQALARLGTLLNTLDRRRMDVHITPIVAETIRQIAAALPFPGSRVLPLLLNPRLTDTVLWVLGKNGVTFDSLLHHTVNVTSVRAGDTINVVPSVVEFEMDGRILPGFTAGDFLKELRRLIGGEAEIEILRNEPCPETPDMGFFDVLKTVLTDMHPGCVPIPMLLPGITDARHFARLGIQTYGFIPMNLPPTFDFGELIHAANERVPEDSLVFGMSAIESVILRMGDQP